MWDALCLYFLAELNVDEYVYPDVCGKVSVLYVLIHVYVYGCVDIFGDVFIPLCRVHLCWCLCL